MEATEENVKKIHVQVTLKGKYADVFEQIKNRPEVGEARKNTVTLHELIRKTPEWKLNR